MTRPMRILMCSHNPLDRQLGAPKVLIELADALRLAGAHVELIQPRDLRNGLVSATQDPREYRRLLREFLQSRAGDFDVVEVDHEHLPYPRRDLPDAPLLVARSVLLVLHEKAIRFPQSRSVRSTLSWWLKRRWQLAARVDRALQTMRSADLVNVSNEDDRRRLVASGFADSRIVVLPFGLTDARFASLSENANRTGASSDPTVAFVGSFDYRKGCLDFPQIVERVLRDVPRAKFRLLGTRGLFRTREQVESFFPAHLRGALEIVESFDADALPSLLEGARVGVFPSYFEGFGFGVLEMLASGLPVVAYDAPGPGMMLRGENLVRAGDVESMSQRLVMLLRDEALHARERSAALETARRFRWGDIAERTLDTYADAIARRARKPG